MKKIIFILLSLMFIIPVVSAGINNYVDFYNYNTDATFQTTQYGGLDEIEPSFITYGGVNYFVLAMDNSTIFIYDDSMQIVQPITLQDVYINQETMRKIELATVGDAIYINLVGSNVTGYYYIAITYLPDDDTYSSNYVSLIGSPAQFDIGCNENGICAIQTILSDDNSSYAYEYVDYSGQISYGVLLGNEPILRDITGMGYKPLVDSNNNMWFFYERNSTDNFLLKLYDTSFNQVDIVEIPAGNLYSWVYNNNNRGVYEIEYNGLNYYVYSYEDFYSTTYYGNIIIMNENHDVIYSDQEAGDNFASFRTNMMSGLDWDDEKENFIIDWEARTDILSFNLAVLNTSIRESEQAGVDPENPVYHFKYGGLLDVADYGYNMMYYDNIYDDENSQVYNGSFTQSVVYNSGSNDYIALSKDGETKVFIYGVSDANQLPDINVLYPSTANPTIYNFLGITVIAQDEENDTIYYAFNCDWKDNLPIYPKFVEGSTGYCIYNTGGIKKIRVFVTDAVHGTNYKSYKDISITSLYNVTADLGEECNFFDDFNYIDSIKNHKWDYDEAFLITPNDFFQLPMSEDYYVWRDVSCSRTVYNLTYEVIGSPDPASDWAIVNQIIGDNDVTACYFYIDKDRNLWYSDGTNIIEYGKYDKANYNVSLNINLETWTWSLAMRNNADGVKTLIMQNKSINPNFKLNPIVRKIAINNFNPIDFGIDNVRWQSSGAFVGDTLNLAPPPTIEEITDVEHFTGTYSFGGIIFNQGSGSGNFQASTYNMTLCDQKGYKYSTCPIFLLRDDIIKRSTEYIFANFLYFIIFIIFVIIIVFIIVQFKSR